MQNADNHCHIETWRNGGSNFAKEVTKMKFLIIGEPTPIPEHVSKEQILKLYQESMGWLEKQLDSGKMLCHYIFPGQGGMAIVDVDSNDELHKLLRSYPLQQFFDWEIRPLCDWKPLYAESIEYYRK